MTRALFFLLLAPACWTENSYLGNIASTTCRALEECDKGAFDSEYSDIDDCVDEFLDYSEPAQECTMEAECEFDAKEAKRCDEAIRKADCEDFTEGDWADDCSDIYDCTDEQLVEIGTCLAEG